MIQVAFFNFLCQLGTFVRNYVQQTTSKGPLEKSYFSGENGYFFNFGAKFLKLLQPYGSKNIFSQTAHLRYPWV